MLGAGCPLRFSHIFQGSSLKPDVLGGWKGVRDPYAISCTYHFW